MENLTSHVLNDKSSQSSLIGSCHALEAEKNIHTNAISRKELVTVCAVLYVFMDSEYILTVVGTVDNRVLLHSEIFGDPIVLKKILILMTTRVLITVLGVLPFCNTPSTTGE